MKKRKFYLAFAVVFLSGIIIGFFAGNLSSHSFRRKPRFKPSPKTDMKSFIKWKLFCRLKLTDEQKKKVTPIVEKWCPKMLEGWKLSAPTVKDAFFGMYDEIEPLLTKEQCKELEKSRQNTLRRITMNNSFKLEEKKTKGVTEKKPDTTK